MTSLLPFYLELTGCHVELDVCRMRPELVEHAKAKNFKRFFDLFIDADVCGNLYTRHNDDDTNDESNEDLNDGILDAASGATTGTTSEDGASEILPDGVRKYFKVGDFRLFDLLGNNSFVGSSGSSSLQHNEAGIGTSNSNDVNNIISGSSWDGLDTHVNSLFMDEGELFEHHLKSSINYMQKTAGDGHSNSESVSDYARCSTSISDAIHNNNNNVTSNAADFSHSNCDGLVRKHSDPLRVEEEASGTNRDLGERDIANDSSADDSNKIQFESREKRPKVPEKRGTLTSLLRQLQSLALNIWRHCGNAHFFPVKVLAEFRYVFRTRRRKSLVSPSSSLSQRRNDNYASRSNSPVETTAGSSTETEQRRQQLILEQGITHNSPEESELSPSNYSFLISEDAIIHDQSSPNAEFERSVLRLFSSSSPSSKDNDSQNFAKQNDPSLYKEHYRALNQAHLNTSNYYKLLGINKSFAKTLRIQYPHESLHIAKLASVHDRWIEFANSGWQINAGLGLQHSMTFYWAQYELTNYSDFELGTGEEGVVGSARNRSPIDEYGDVIVHHIENDNSGFDSENSDLNGHAKSETSDRPKFALPRTSPWSTAGRHGGISRLGIVPPTTRATRSETTSETSAASGPHSSAREKVHNINPGASPGENASKSMAGENAVVGRCGFQNGIDWDLLLKFVQIRNREVQCKLIRQVPHNWDLSTVVQKLEGLASQYPLTGVRSDCFLGVFSFNILDALCSTATEDFMHRNARLLQEFEVLLFFFDYTASIEVPVHPTLVEGGNRGWDASESDDNSISGGNSFSNGFFKGSSGKKQVPKITNARTAMKINPKTNTEEKRYTRTGFQVLNMVEKLVLETEWPIWPLLLDYGEMVSNLYSDHVPNLCDLCDSEKDIERGKYLLAALSSFRTRGVYTDYPKQNMLNFFGEGPFMRNLHVKKEQFWKEVVLRENADLSSSSATEHDSNSDSPGVGGDLTINESGVAEETMSDSEAPGSSKQTSNAAAVRKAVRHGSKLYASKELLVESMMRKLHKDYVPNMESFEEMQKALNEYLGEAGKPTLAVFPTRSIVAGSESAEPAEIMPKVLSEGVEQYRSAAALAKALDDQELSDSILHSAGGSSASNSSNSMGVLWSLDNFETRYHAVGRTRFGVVESQDSVLLSSDEAEQKETTPLESGASAHAVGNSSTDNDSSPLSNFLGSLLGHTLDHSLAAIAKKFDEDIYIKEVRTRKFRILNRKQREIFRREMAAEREVLFEKLETTEVFNIQTGENSDPMETTAAGVKTALNADATKNASWVLNQWEQGRKSGYRKMVAKGERGMVDELLGMESGRLEQFSGGASSHNLFGERNAARDVRKKKEPRAFEMLDRSVVDHVFTRMDDFVTEESDLLKLLPELNRLPDLVKNESKGSSGKLNRKNASIQKSRRNRNKSEVSNGGIIAQDGDSIYEDDDINADSEGSDNYDSNNYAEDHRTNVDDGEGGDDVVTDGEALFVKNLARDPLLMERTLKKAGAHEALLGSELLLADARGCPFGQALAGLFAAYRTREYSKWLPLVFDVIKSWDAFATDKAGWDRRFFYDLFSSRWPVIRFLAYWYEERMVFAKAGGDPAKMIRVLETYEREVYDMFETASYVESMNKENPYNPFYMSQTGLRSDFSFDKCYYDEENSNFYGRSTGTSSNSRNIVSQPSAQAAASVSAFSSTSTSETTSSIATGATETAARDLLIDHSLTDGSVYEKPWLSDEMLKFQMYHAPYNQRGSNPFIAGFVGASDKSNRSPSSPKNGLHLNLSVDIDAIAVDIVTRNYGLEFAGQRGESRNSNSIDIGVESGHYDDDDDDSTNLNSISVIRKAVEREVQRELRLQILSQSSRENSESNSSKAKDENSEGFLDVLLEETFSGLGSINKTNTDSSADEQVTIALSNSSGEDEPPLIIILRGPDAIDNEGSTTRSVAEKTATENTANSNLKNSAPASNKKPAALKILKSEVRLLATKATFRILLLSQRGAPRSMRDFFKDALTFAANKHSVCKYLPKLDIVFLAGTSGGSQWGSFTARGRQMARAIRKHTRGKARAWNHQCVAYCDRIVDLKRKHGQRSYKYKTHAQYSSRKNAAGPGRNDDDIPNYSRDTLAASKDQNDKFSGPPDKLLPIPNVVVHLKFPCKCAIGNLTQHDTVHIFDPVDILTYNLTQVNQLFSGMFVQTGIGTQDWLETPLLSNQKLLHAKRFLTGNAGVSRAITPKRIVDSAGFGRLGVAHSMSTSESIRKSAGKKATHRTKSDDMSSGTHRTTMRGSESFEESEKPAARKTRSEPVVMEDSFRVKTTLQNEIAAQRRVFQQTFYPEGFFMESTSNGAAGVSSDSARENSTRESNGAKLISNDFFDVSTVLPRDFWSAGNLRRYVLLLRSYAERVLFNTAKKAFQENAQYLTEKSHHTHDFHPFFSGDNPATRPADWSFDANNEATNSQKNDGSSSYGGITIDEDNQKSYRHFFTEEASTMGSGAFGGGARTGSVTYMRGGGDSAIIGASTSARPLNELLHQQQTPGSYLVTDGSLRNYGNSPAFKGLAGIYHVPHHSSNFKQKRIPLNRDIRTVGLHLSHPDFDLFNATLDFLDANYNGNLPNGSTSNIAGDSAIGQKKNPVQMWHIDPNTQFYNTGGHIINPQQTDFVYDTFAAFDVAVIREFNCMEEIEEFGSDARTFFCKRYKTGQRLMNHFSVGVPVISFREGGHLELHGLDYPLMVDTIPEAMAKLDYLVKNPDVHAEISRKVYRIAQAYTAEKIAWRYVMAIIDVVMKTGKDII